MAIEITKDNFDTEVKNSGKVCVVDFWAEWCGPCRQLAPIIDELSKDFEGKAVVGKVDVDKEPDLAQNYSVRSIPTIVFIKNGEVADRAVGASSKEQLAQKINELIG